MRTMKQLEDANAEIGKLITEQDAKMTSFNNAYNRSSALKTKLCVIADGINQERELIKEAEKEAAEKKELNDI